MSPPASCASSRSSKGPPTTVTSMSITATDLNLGAFSEHPPWLVEPDGMAWRRGVPELRQRTQADVPHLTRRRRLPPGGRVITVGAVLVQAMASWYLIERRKSRKVGDPAISRAGLSRRLRKAFTRLGPTYIKLGQIISSGEGIFPEELVGEFRLLRDKVPPEPFDTVRTIIEADLGRPLSALFTSIDQTPLAAASIAQVHAATLTTGEQ